MLKWEVLEQLTVEEWARFKKFVASRPAVYETLADGRKVEAFLESDLHEFMTVMGLIKADAEAVKDTAKEAPVQLELDFKANETKEKVNEGLPPSPPDSRP